ncbi:MAG: ABC transporter ATP-binding protein [Dehalococcoidia bacterium]
MAYVVVDRVVKSFWQQGGSLLQVLNEVSFETKEYGITCLLGPSGCGKSTMLNIIAGLERLDGGRVQAMTEGGAIGDSSLRLGYVFQDPRLLNWKRVDENIAFALRGTKVPKEEWERRVARYLELVGLLDFRREYPLFLSGGMRQRVGLGRGLAIEPAVLLMDEPFSKLDQLTARRLREDTLAICRTLRQTALLVTHDVEEAIFLGDRIVILSSRPAVVAGTYENPIPAMERCWDDLQFIEFKKEILATVLNLGSPT